MAMFLLAEHKAGIKFMCYTNFGPKMMPLLNCDIFKKPRNPSLMMRTLRFAKIDWIDLPFLLLTFTAFSALSLVDFLSSLKLKVALFLAFFYFKNQTPGPR